MSELSYPLLPLFGSVIEVYLYHAIFNGFNHSVTPKLVHANVVSRHQVFAPWVAHRVIWFYPAITRPNPAISGHYPAMLRYPDIIRKS